MACLISLLRKKNPDSFSVLWYCVTTLRWDWCIYDRVLHSYLSAFVITAPIAVAMDHYLAVILTPQPLQCTSMFFYFLVEVSYEWVCVCNGLSIKEGLFLYCWLLCFRGRLPICCPVFKLGDHSLFINQFFAPTWQDPSWHFIDKKLNRVH